MNFAFRQNLILTSTYSFGDIIGEIMLSDLTHAMFMQRWSHLDISGEALFTPNRSVDYEVFTMSSLDARALD